MPSDGTLILLGFMMLGGQILLMMMWQNNWFKKENFKIQKFNVMAENRLNLKKLEKDLGLTPGKAPKEEKSITENIGGWFSLLKSLDPDQIKKLADTFLTSGEEDEYEEEEGEDIIGTILRNVDEKTIKNFIDGLKGNKTQEITAPRTNNY